MKAAEFILPKEHHDCESCLFIGRFRKKSMFLHYVSEQEIYLYCGTIIAFSLEEAVRHRRKPAFVVRALHVCRALGLIPETLERKHNVKKAVCARAIQRS